MDKKKSKKKSKSKEKSENPTSKSNSKMKLKIKKVVQKSDKDKKKNKSNIKNKSKTKKKSSKKGKKIKEEKKSDKLEPILITQKLGGNKLVKKKTKKKEEKEEKTFSEIKIGTPHFDTIPHIKKMLTEKENAIKQLNEEKIILREKIRNIYNKLDGIETQLDATPEQKQKMTMLLFILNLNKKNYMNSTNIKNKYKKQYTDLLIKNDYDPIEKLINIRKKINISKTENFEILKLIGNLKNSSSKYRWEQKFPKKEKKYSEIIDLINELNSLNNQKHEALIKLKNSKKIINSSISKFKSVLTMYDENQISNQKSMKLDRDINLLKNDLLINDENELYNKIYNGQSLIFNSHNINIAKLKIIRNTPYSHEQTFIDKESKDIRKNKSTEYLKINKNFLNDIKEPSIMKKRIFNKNILPKISNFNDTNSKSSYLDQNEYNPLNKSIIFDELSESRIGEINFHEINFKKEYYKIIDKKLENSIKDIEIMYKRKIKNTEDLLNSNKKKYLDIKKNNDLLKIEIQNLYKIIRIQLKQIIDCK